MIDSQALDADGLLEAHLLAARLEGEALGAVARDAAHDRHGGVLIRTGRLSEPAVIGNVDQKICPILGELADQIRKSHLITDESREIAKTGLKECELSARRKICLPQFNFLKDAHVSGVGYSLGKRNQLHLVVFFFQTGRG